MNFNTYVYHSVDLLSKSDDLAYEPLSSNSLRLEWLLIFEFSIAETFQSGLFSLNWYKFCHFFLLLSWLSNTAFLASTGMAIFINLFQYLLDRAIFSDICSSVAEGLSPKKLYLNRKLYFSLQVKIKKICIVEGPIGPPHLTNMDKITYRQAAIDSSMPGEFKKYN